MPIRAGNLEDYFGAQRFDDHPYSSRQTKTGKKGGMDKVKFQSTPLARTQSMPQDSKDVKVSVKHTFLHFAELQQVDCEVTDAPLRRNSSWCGPVLDAEAVAGL
jgi:hypothetical protein